MTPLTPLQPLFDVYRGRGLPLPAELCSLYGPLWFPARSDTPHVFANFVSSLDGVVSLGLPGQAGGGEISGFNPHDRMVMGLLRAVSDAVLVGAGTLRSVPGHIWTAGYVYPALAGSYQGLRDALGKPEPPLNVIITASGEVDPNLRVFQSGETPVLVVTTTQGLVRLREAGLPPAVRVQAVPGVGRLDTQAILEVVRRVRPSDLLLVEGGPHLLGDFFADECVDELFLTLAPQVAGRGGELDRPGLVAGQVFAPERSRWGSLVSVKRGGDHLFLRYAFSAQASEVAGEPAPEGEHEQRLEERVP